MSFIQGFDVVFYSKTFVDQDCGLLLNSFDLILRRNFSDPIDQGSRFARVRVWLCGLGFAASKPTEHMLHSSTPQGASASTFGCAHSVGLAVYRFGLKPLVRQLNCFLCMQSHLQSTVCLLLPLIIDDSLSTSIWRNLLRSLVLR